jgi:hypothetical protein
VKNARALILLTGVLSLVLLATSAAGTAADRTADAKRARLQSFGNCGALLGHVKQKAMPLVQAWGLGGSFAKGGPPVILSPPSMAADAGAARELAPTQTTEAPEFSTTNVQEAGVDEPDFVKSNGSHIFVLHQGTLRAVDVRANKPRLAGSLALESGYDAELLLHGNRLLVLARGGYWIEPLPAASRLIAPMQQMKSTLTEIDVSNPSAMKVVRTLTLDGSSYVSARLMGSSVRVVTTSALPRALPFHAPTAGTPEAMARAVADNRAVVRSSRATNWLPKYSVKRRGAKATPKRSLVQCRDVYRPTEFSGLGMLTVLTIDLRKGLDPIDSEAIVTDGRIVYASPESLYVTTESWADRPTPEQPMDAPQGVTTEIHKFDISDPAKTRYRGTGQVSGYLLSQWSLSEYKGVLRVASTEAPSWWEGVPQRESESFVTTLTEQEGKLVVAGRIGELGKGERIYAVRFMGDVGYVVTFRQVDPLYTLDLSNPKHPAVLGELKIRGYSAYLHPVGEDLLLGVGQDASDEGRVLGTQLSLFDVSNLRRPSRLAQTIIGPGSSEAEYDHHAFLYWAKAGFVAVPVQTYSQEAGQTPFVGAIGFRIGRQRGIDELGRISHDPDADAVKYGGYYPIRRSLVVGDALYTVSDLGVKANSLSGFGGLGWAPFPQPTPQSSPGIGVEGDGIR